MHDEKPAQWERALANCPHCGRLVLFDSAGVCPSCKIRGDAAVTDEDRHRIEADREGLLRVRTAPPRSGEGGFGTGVFVGLVLGLWGFLGARWLSQNAEMKRGAAYGLVGRLVVQAVLISFMAAARG